MFKWVERLLGRTGTESPVPYHDGGMQPSGPSVPSSSERANQARMQERLDKFLDKQREIETRRGGTQEEIDARLSEKESRKRGQLAAQYGDNSFFFDGETEAIAKKAAKDESLLLEGSGRLVPEGGEDGQVLGNNAGQPEWVDSGFPDLADVSDGTVFYVSGEKVEMLAPPATASVLCFDPDTEEPSWVEAGEDGTILQVAASNIEFAHLLWIDGTSGGGE